MQKNFWFYGITVNFLPVTVKLKALPLVRSSCCDTIGKR